MSIEILRFFGEEEISYFSIFFTLIKNKTVSFSGDSFVYKFLQINLI